MSSNTCAFLCGMAVGATLMYFLDPQGGSRRRGMIEDTASDWANQAGDWAGRAEEYAERKARDLRDRAGGLVNDARHAVGY